MIKFGPLWRNFHWKRSSIRSKSFPTKGKALFQKQPPIQEHSYAVRIASIPSIVSVQSLAIKDWLKDQFLDLLIWFELYISFSYINQALLSMLSDQKVVTNLICLNDGLDPREQCVCIQYVILFWTFFQLVGNVSVTMCQLIDNESHCLGNFVEVLG